MTDRITYLEGRILNWIAYNEMNSGNGTRPHNAAETQCYCWVDQMGDAINRPDKVVTGILGSLVNKGFISTYQCSAAEKAAGDDDLVGMTEKGFAAWDKWEKELKAEIEADEAARRAEEKNYYVGQAEAVKILKSLRGKKYYMSISVANHVIDDPNKYFPVDSHLPVSRDYLVKEALHKEKGKYGPFRMVLQGKAYVRIHVMSASVFVG